MIAIMKCKFNPVIFRISEMQNIFVYGTLQSPRLIQKLTGRTFKSTPGILQGYKRYCILNADYPAIIEKEGHQTEGKIFENVDDQSMEILSFYEGEDYIQKGVNVFSNGNLIKAIAFVWVGDFNILDDRNWDLYEFEKYTLQEYIKFVVPEIRKSFLENDERKGI
jgi:gamma-glutamylcyclotransferase (GGCT)/AIG2-like uncharacterized protein YtfP